MTRETVQYCPICRCKTWFVAGVCEWADGHERMERVPPAQPVPPRQGG
jgi:hypothetical protein